MHEVSCVGVIINTDALSAYSVHAGIGVNACGTMRVFMHTCAAEHVGLCRI